MAKAAHSSFRYRKHRSRPLIAVALVVLVGAGGAWLMFSESGDGLAADESIPWSTMTDDRYVADEPVDYTPKPRQTPSRSPSATPSRTPTRTPSTAPTPTETPTPSDEPTSVPTSSSTTVPTTDPRPTTRPTTTPRPTHSNTPSPTKTPKPTKTTPPWTDPGNMSEDEQALFGMIDNARQDKGCAALLPDTGLRDRSRSRAGDMAEDRDYGGGARNQATAGGGGSVSASSAYEQMMSNYGGVLLDCDLDRLGVGKAEDEDCALLLICSSTTGWAATFGYR